MIDIAGVDGVMIGRAALANPWMIRQTVHYLEAIASLKIPFRKSKLRNYTYNDLRNLKGEAVPTKIP